MASLLKRIVKNDAMREDPVEIYNWRVFVLTASVSPTLPLSAMRRDVMRSDAFEFRLLAAHC
jgi:hypothetical protein